MASRTTLAASVLAAIFAASLPAYAAPTAADKETARGLMTEGRAARDRGDKQAALKAFAGADAIMHVPTTGLELARAQADAGQLVEARDTALRVSRAPETSNEPKPFKEAREQASELEKDISERIPSLKVIVTGVPEGMTPDVTVDGAAVPSESIGQARKLNPGHHVIVAKAGGAAEKEDVDLAEKEAKEVTLALSGAKGPEKPEKPTGETKPTEPPPEDKGGGRGVMYAGIGLAGLGVVVGGVTGFLTLSKTSSIKNQCNGNECPQKTWSDIDSAKTMAMISTIGFAAAGVGAVIAVVGLVTGKPPAPPTEHAPEGSAARVEPWIGVGAAGLRGTF